MPIVKRHFLPLGLNILNIVEVGSRDALDAISFSLNFDCTVYAFEPDPINILECKKNISKFKATEKVKLYELALSDKCGIFDFYSVDPNLSQNRGASSFYLINFNNRSLSDPDFRRDPIQKKIKVKVARFDMLELPTPDLLLLDVQGSELLVCKGFGEKIRNVSAIILETSFSQNYFLSSKFHSLHNYLINHGFIFAGTNQGGEVSEILPKQNLFKRFFNLYEPDFDCIYLKSSVVASVR